MSTDTLTLDMPRTGTDRPGSDAEGERQLLLADFDAVVRGHQRRIFRLLLGWTHDEEGADALTQETFLRAWRNRTGFRGDAALATWLTRIALHVAHDQARSRRQQFWRTLFRRPPAEDAEATERLLDELPATAPTAERRALDRERVRALHRAVAALPRRQREVFQLRHFEELQLTEIAEILGLAEGTVKIHLSRATHAVRSAVDDRETRP